MFQHGDRVFLPGSSGEPRRVATKTFASPDIQITTTFIPGINIIPEDTFTEGSHCTGLFMQPGLTAAQRGGRFRHLPLSYAAALKYFEEQPPFDCCILQLSPPNAGGFCSLGPAAEFTPSILRRARRIIAIINPEVPRIKNAPFWRLANCDSVIDDHAPLTCYDPGIPDATALTIAGHAVAFVPDGATLQLGLGKVPASIYNQLKSHRRLKFHTGLMTDGIMDLAQHGALDKNYDHKTTVILGTEMLYRWAAERTDIHIMGCEHIHAQRILATIDGLIAINSALEVDLFGQCNLEIASGRAISGAGGAPDFAHAAQRSQGGVSIVALPATFGDGKGSRIKPLLGPDAIVSLPRTDVDVVITEAGIADLRGKSVHERAEALIEVAALPFQATLTEAWAEIKRRL